MAKTCFWCGASRDLLNSEQQEQLATYKEDLQLKFALWRSEMKAHNARLKEENERLNFQIEWLAKQPIYKGVFDLKCPTKAGVSDAN